MERKAYTAADIAVLSFEEAVRKRPGMYFRTGPESPDLPTNILLEVVYDAVHPFTNTAQDDGTRVTFDLSSAFLPAGAVISTSPDQLRPRGSGCETCSSARRDETLTIRDFRL